MDPFSPDDRPGPEEQPIRARVPDHVAGGAFSTGVIIMTAQTEFVLDFVQNLGRPHQVVSRVVMPHPVLPQLIDALFRNIELYRSRWGELPMTPMPGGQSDRTNGMTGGAGGAPAQGAGKPPQPDAGWGVQYAGLPVDGDSSTTEDTDTGSRADGQSGPPPQGADDASTVPGHSASPELQPEQPNPDSLSTEPQGPGRQNPGGQGEGAAGASEVGQQAGTASSGQPAGGGDSQLGAGTRQATAQEVYDDLKIRDEILSGAYANAVMIGHGPHEFSFDFITNFYPNSAVSARVFLAAGQVPRLLDSLRGTWDQMQRRLRQQGRPGNPPPGSAGGGSDGFDFPNSSPGSGPY